MEEPIRGPQNSVYAQKLLPETIVKMTANQILVSMGLVTKLIRSTNVDVLQETADLAVQMTVYKIDVTMEHV
ncbi:Hypothetical predicted protein [Mytilus galloprovincialis]|uniref:Uncharacterized protein n=1 Tax=Mytilus galloprovincialis TaxID=29158 RepID=A0A8B6C1J4_MYTGA|nr:Hypothetical predicted protein [Mytilus galloprovincialis]